MLLSALLNHDRDPKFLGFKLNREQVKSVISRTRRGTERLYAHLPQHRAG